MTNLATTNLYIVARVSVGLTFLIAGLHKILGWAGPAAWMTSKGLPMVSLLLGIATIIEIMGALLLLFNLKVRWTSLVLAVFLLIVTLSMHTFWNMEGMMFQTTFLDFIQNIAIIGGLIGLSLAADKEEHLI